MWRDGNNRRWRQGYNSAGEVNWYVYDHAGRACSIFPLGLDFDSRDDGPFRLIADMDGESA